MVFILMSIQIEKIIVFRKFYTFRLLYYTKIAKNCIKEKRENKKNTICEKNGVFGLHKKACFSINQQTKLYKTSHNETNYHSSVDLHQSVFDFLQPSMLFENYELVMLLIYLP